MERLTSAFGAILLCATISVAHAAPVKYVMDPTHTFVSLTRNNYGFSNPIIVAVIKHGTLQFDRADPSKSSLRVVVPVVNIHTFVPMLNKEFRSAMFFNNAKYPDITYQSTRVRSIGKDRYRITGDLTAHGITKPVILIARLNKIGINPFTHRQAIGFDAYGSLERSDFGLGFNTPNVSNKIKIRITVQADAVK